MSGGDAVQQASLERLLTPDRIIEAFSAIITRGGALFSAFFLFFFSRQAAFILARLFPQRRQGQGGSTHNDLTGFHVPRRVIWVLSLCLPVIIFCRISSLELIEIAVWNILVICAIMFLAQGVGIVLHNFARRSMPVLMRLLCALAFVFIVFSPGINVMVMGFLVILGIAETWIPLSKMRNEGSTPGP
jgi:hypothetical protein